MQIVLSVVLIGVCAYLGRVVTNNYRRRERLFEDLKLFCASAKNDIAFFQLRLAETFNKAALSGGRDLAQLSSVCVASIENSKSRLTERADIENLGLLKPPDVDLLEQFFNSLGKTDSLTQSERISSFERVFEEKAASARSETKSKGLLFQRLAPFVGLLLVVLCL